MAKRNEALRLAREALVLDADSVQALSAIAYAQWQHVAFRTVTDRHAAWQEGMEAAMRGIALSQSSACHALKVRARVLAPEVMPTRARTEQAEQRQPIDDGTEYRRRYQTFLRIAAGFEDLGSADAIR